MSKKVFWISAVMWPFVLGFLDGLGDILTDAFNSLLELVLYHVIYRTLYALECALCRVISWMQELFNAFSGLRPITYNGREQYLMNVFFGNKVINAIYMGMAAIGIVLIVIFTIIAVVKKSFDIEDQVKRSHGQILRSMFRGILAILCMNIVIVVATDFTNVLMQAVDRVFTYAPDWAEGPKTITYTDEHFAAMGRVLNTIGNYSLNPSYKSRYNINMCYNEIRGDLRYLYDERVFNYNYPTTDASGNPDNTWQSALQAIVNARDLAKEMPVDTYDATLSNAIINCIDILKTDGNFHALKSFTRESVVMDSSTPLDRTLFLMGTMGMGNTAAAKNNAYNKNPSFADEVRAPYYMGTKNIYDIDQVDGDFNISFMKTNYLTVYVGACILIYNMALIIVNCAVRIFNLLFLYVAAPPLIATAPLDGGEKYKQWLTSFIAQLFSVFATVISMRLFLMFVPIIMSPGLKLADSAILDVVGKLVLLWAGTKAVNKSVSLLNNILGVGQEADLSNELKQSAVGQAVGQVKGAFEQSTVGAPLNRVAGYASKVASLPGNAVNSVVGGAADAAFNAGMGIVQAPGTLGKAAFNKAIGNPVRNAAARMSNAIEGWSQNTWIDSPEQAQQKKQQKEQGKQQEEQRQFQARTLNALNKMAGIEDEDGGGSGGSPSGQSNKHNNGNNNSNNGDGNGSGANNNNNNGNNGGNPLDVARQNMRNLGNEGGEPVDVNVHVNVDQNGQQNQQNQQPQQNQHNQGGGNVNINNVQNITNVNNGANQQQQQPQPQQQQQQPQQQQPPQQPQQPPQ